MSIIRLVSQIFGKKLIKLTEQNLSHKDVIKKKTIHYHFQGAKLKTSLDNNKKVVSKWVIIKYFFLGGTWRTRTRWAIFKCKVRDNSAPKMILGAKPETYIFLSFVSQFSRTSKTFKRETARRKYYQHEINIVYIY